MAYPRPPRSRVVAAVLGLALLAACSKADPADPNPGADAAIDSGPTPKDAAMDAEVDAAIDAGPAPTDAAAVDGGWTPPAACALPFEVGPCDAAIPVWAFVEGACVSRTYGGCQGNDNRFGSLEACLAACAGRPAPNGCPSGRIAQEICLQCGLAGGCASRGTVCALPCDADGGVTPSSCPSSLAFCYQGVCQMGGCI